MSRRRPGKGRGVGEKPGFDAGMGDSDRGRVLRQFRVSSALQLVQLAGMIPLGVEDKDKSGRTAVEGLTFREPDLLPQSFSLKEWQRSPPDQHRLGPIAQPVDENRHDASGRRGRLIFSSAKIGLPLADDLDNGPEFRHLRIALPH